MCPLPARYLAHRPNTKSAALLFHLIFKTFDWQNLAFEYEETPPDQPNHFCRLVSRDTGEPVSA